MSTKTRTFNGETFALAEEVHTAVEAEIAKHEYQHAGYKTRVIYGGKMIEVYVGPERKHMPRCCTANPPSEHQIQDLPNREPVRVRFYEDPYLQRQHERRGT